MGARVPLCGGDGHPLTLVALANFRPKYQRNAAAVITHAITSAPASAITAKSAPAAMADKADRLVAHHMNVEAMTAPTTAATAISRPVTICHRNRPTISSIDQT